MPPLNTISRIFGVGMRPVVVIDAWRCRRSVG
jgi:hypothetical protein